MGYIVDTDNCPFDVKAIQVLGIADNPEDGNLTVWSRTHGIEEYEIAHDCISDNNITIKQNEELAYEDGYRQGMNDTWDIAGQIVLPRDMGGFTGDEVEKIFGVHGWETRSIFKMKAYEVVNRVKRFKEDLKIGDEVVEDNSGNRFIVVEIHDDNITLCRPNKKCFEFYPSEKSLVKKTGKHYPLEEIIDDFN